MKKFLLCLAFILFLSLSLIPVLSVEITSCSSGDTDGICETGQICTCRISGECSNGNLLLHQGNLLDPLCSPQIVGNSVSINPDYCQFVEGFLYAIADCDEGQSLEKRIMISQLEVAAESTSTTTPVTTTTTTEEPTEVTINECFGGKGYCEDIMPECPTGYYYCPEYNYDCPGYDEKCCCPETERTQIVPSVNFKLIIFIILAAVIGVVLFLFFVRQTKGGMTFDKLRKKWSK